MERVERVQCPTCGGDEFDQWAICKEGTKLTAICKECDTEVNLNELMREPASEWNEAKEFERLQEAYRIDDAQPGDYEDDYDRANNPEEEDEWHCGYCGEFVDDCTCGEDGD